LCTAFSSARHLEALHVKQHARPLLGKDGIGREMACQFDLRFQLPRKSLGSFTCRKSASWDRWLYYPWEGRHAVDLLPKKILRFQLGSNQQSWVPEASMLTTRPTKPPVSGLHLQYPSHTTRQQIH
jgi:hypothetical protein